MAPSSVMSVTQGRITEVGVTGGRRPTVLLNQASYHPFGPVAEWTYGNGRQMLRPLNQNYQPGPCRTAYGRPVDGLRVRCGRQPREADNPAGDPRRVVRLRRSEPSDRGQGWATQSLSRATATTPPATA